MTVIDILGYAASAAVLSTFCMSTMIPLRILALVSNVLFAGYGLLDELYPVLVLHVILFPVNLWRLLQMQRLVRDVKRAPNEGLPIERLLPYMTKRHFAAGEILVRKGDPAERLYYLLEGELEVAEVGKRVEAGTMVGEIGVFAPGQRRTATLICRTDCTVFELTGSKAKQLYFQDRTFGFAVVQLIVARLLDDEQRTLAADTA